MPRQPHPRPAEGDAGGVGQEGQPRQGHGLSSQWWTAGTNKPGIVAVERGRTRKVVWVSVHSSLAVAELGRHKNCPKKEPSGHGPRAGSPRALQCCSTAAACHARCA